MLLLLESSKEHETGFNYFQEIVTAFEHSVHYLILSFIITYYLICHIWNYDIQSGRELDGLGKY